MNPKRPSVRSNFNTKCFLRRAAFKKCLPSLYYTGYLGGHNVTADCREPLRAIWQNMSYRLI